MDKQVAELKIRIRDLFVLDFKMNKEKISSLTKKPTEFTIEITIGNKMVEEERSILIDINTIVFLDPEKRIEVCNLSTRIVFEIINYELYPTGKDGHPIFIVDIVSHLIELGYSTTRGILFSKLSGTVIENVKLPLIDTKQFAMNIESQIDKETKKREQKKKKSKKK